MVNELIVLFYLDYCVYEAKIQYFAFIPLETMINVEAVRPLRKQGQEFHYGALIDSEIFPKIYDQAYAEALVIMTLVFPGERFARLKHKFRDVQ